MGGQNGARQALARLSVPNLARPIDDGEVDRLEALGSRLADTRRRIAALPPRRPRSTWDTTPKRSTRPARRATPVRSAALEGAFDETVLETALAAVDGAPYLGAAQRERLRQGLRSLREPGVHWTEPSDRLLLGLDGALWQAALHTGVIETTTICCMIREGNVRARRTWWRRASGSASAAPIGGSSAMASSIPKASVPGMVETNPSTARTPCSQGSVYSVARSLLRPRAT